MRGLGSTSLIGGGQSLDASDPWPGYVRLWPESSVRNLGPNNTFSREGVFAVTKTYKYPAEARYGGWFYSLRSEYTTNETIMIPFNTPAEKEDVYFPFRVYSKGSDGRDIYETSLKFVLGTKRSFSDQAFSNEMIETEEVVASYFHSYATRSTENMCAIRRTQTKLTGYFADSYERMYRPTRDVDIPEDISLPMYFGVHLSPPTNNGVRSVHLHSSRSDLRYSDSADGFYNSNLWTRTSKLLQR